MTKATPISIVRAAVLMPLVTILIACGADEATFSAPNTDLIERAYVERVIRTLAADDMRGRRAFTEDAIRAAEYLAREFAAAGLETMEGAPGYIQDFVVRSVVSGEASMTVNGNELPSERFVVRLGTAEPISWSTGDTEVIVVATDDDLRAEVVAALQGGADVVLLVDPAHAEPFARFADFLGGPTRMLDDGGGSSLAMALVAAGADPTFQVSASPHVTEDRLANVVGMIPGKRADELVLFSAHYDHIGIRPPVDGDSIANGANDNASGATAVVALGKYFASRGVPERTLLFAAFTAEEGGGYGSTHYSTQLDPNQVVAMFNIEMIGKPAVEGPNTAWITGFDRSSFGPLLQEAVRGTEYEFYPDPYPDQNLFYRSDNATLARLGVPAHSISTTPIDVDADYHQVTDHVGTLDLDHLTNTIRAIAMGAETIISGEATPTRVDPSTVN